MVEQELVTWLAVPCRDVLMPLSVRPYYLTVYLRAQRSSASSGSYVVNLRYARCTLVSLMHAVVNKEQHHLAQMPCQVV